MADNSILEKIQNFRAGPRKLNTIQSIFLADIENIKMHLASLTPISFQITELKNKHQKEIKYQNYLALMRKYLKSDYQKFLLFNNCINGLELIYFLLLKHGDDFEKHLSILEKEKKIIFNKRKIKFSSSDYKEFVKTYKNDIIEKFNDDNEYILNKYGQIERDEKKANIQEEKPSMEIIEKKNRALKEEKKIDEAIKRNQGSINDIYTQSPRFIKQNYIENPNGFTLEKRFFFFDNKIRGHYDMAKEKGVFQDIDLILVQHSKKPLYTLYRFYREEYHLIKDKITFNVIYKSELSNATNRATELLKDSNII